MSAAPRRRARTLRAAATLTLSACLVLVATALPALASPRGKTCARIDGCATSVGSPPPLPMAVLGAPEPPSSHLAVAVATSPRSSAKARAQSGMLMADADRGRRIRCGGYRLKAPTTFQFQLQPAASVSSASGVFRLKLYITYETTERITNTTADGIQFCLGADFGFKTLSGRPAPARRLPDGTRGHVGLLPPCPTPLPPPGDTRAPCLEPVTTVNDASSTTGVDVILRARIPTLVGVATVRGAGDPARGDPWGGG
jgi:hypothetical protein